MLGELGTSGNFGGVFLHQFGNVKLRCNAQTQGSKWVGYQTTVDYAGSDYTASLTLANPDIISNSVVAVAQYLQAFTPKLSLGTELLFQRGGGMEVGLLSLGGMYKATGWEASGKLGMHAWNLSYLHSVPEVKVRCFTVNLT
jgi:mitochondrial import receptor subunit TOM40